MLVQRTWVGGLHPVGGRPFEFVHVRRPCGCAGAACDLLLVVVARCWRRTLTRLTATIAPQFFLGGSDLYEAESPYCPIGNWRENEAT